MIVINWRKSIVSITLALAILIPAAAFAAGNANGEKNITAFTKQLQARGGWFNKGRELPEELKAKLEELKGKLDKGEITQEQFREEMKKLK